MKVDNQNLTNDRYLKRLQQQQKNLITAKESELEQIKKQYNHKKELIKQEGIKQLEAERMAQQQKILEANQTAKERLTDLQKQQQLEEFILQQQHQHLVENAKAKIANVNEQFATQYQEKLMETNDLNRDINEKTQNQMRQIALQAQNQIEQEKFKAHDLIYNNENLLQQRLQADEKHFNLALEHQQQEFKQRIEQVQKEHLGELKKLQHHNKITLENEKQTQANKLNYIRNFYQNKLKQEEEAFQAKYHHQLQNHQEILERLKNQFEQEIAKFKLGQATTKDQLLTRQQDPFYHMTIFNPKIIDTPKEIILQLQLSEHEVDNLQINVQKKDVDLNLTRRFAEQITTNDGSINRSKRSEIISKKIHFPQFLKEKSLTKEYHDGILTIHIQKDA